MTLREASQKLTLPLTSSNRSSYTSGENLLLHLARFFELQRGAFSSQVDHVGPGLRPQKRYSEGRRSRHVHSQRPISRCISSSASHPRYRASFVMSNIFTVIVGRTLRNSFFLHEKDQRFSCLSPPHAAFFFSAVRFALVRVLLLGVASLTAGALGAYELWSSMCVTCVAVRSITFGGRTAHLQYKLSSATPHLLRLTAYSGWASLFYHLLTTVSTLAISKRAQD